MRRAHLRSSRNVYVRPQHEHEASFAETSRPGSWISPRTSERATLHKFALPALPMSQRPELEEKYRYLDILNLR